MNLAKNLANQLKAKEKLEQYSIREMANCADVSVGAIQEYLSGDSNPQLDTLLQIAKNLHIPEAALVSCSFGEDADECLQLMLKLLDKLAGLPVEQQEMFGQTFWNLIRFYTSRNK